MRYYGIKMLASETQKSYIWFITESVHNSWRMFFTYPNKDGERYPHKLAIAEAIKAYEAIGYRCVELYVSEKEGEEK